MIEFFAAHPHKDWLIITTPCGFSSLLCSELKQIPLHNWGAGSREFYHPFMLSQTKPLESCFKQRESSIIFPTLSQPKYLLFVFLSHKTLGTESLFPLVSRIPWGQKEIQCFSYLRGFPLPSRVWLYHFLLLYSLFDTFKNIFQK